MLAQEQKILDISIGRKIDRTLVPEVRAALEQLGKIARTDMSSPAGKFVDVVLAEVARHECNVNTDRSFKPFMEILRCSLELAGYDKKK